MILPILPFVNWLMTISLLLLKNVSLLIQDHSGITSGEAGKVRHADTHHVHSAPSAS